MRRLHKDYRVWLVLLVLGYTLAGFVLVPWLVKDQLLAYLREDRGLQAELARVEFNPFLFRLSLHGLAVRDPGGAPIAALDEAYVDFDPAWLVRGIWRFQALRLSAPQLDLQRAASGDWNVAALLPPAAAEPAAEEERGPPSVSFGLVEIEAGRLGYADLARQPAFRQEIAPVELRVTELATLPDTSGAYQLDLGIGDTGSLRLSGTASLTPFGADTRVEAHLPLPRIAAYVATTDPRIQLTRGSVALAGHIRLDSAQGLKLRLRDGAVQVRDLALADAAQHPVLELARVDLDGAELDWPEQRLQVDSLTLADAQLTTWLNPDGSFNLLQYAGGAAQAAETAPSTAPLTLTEEPLTEEQPTEEPPTEEQSAEEQPAPAAEVEAAVAGGERSQEADGEPSGADRPGTAEDPAVAASTAAADDRSAEAAGQRSDQAVVADKDPEAPAPGLAGDWSVTLASLALREIGLSFEDRTLADPTVQHLRIETLTAADIDLAAESRFSLQGRLLVNDGGIVEVEGSAGVAPVAADIRLHVADIALAPANPYLQRALRSAITEGVLGGELRLNYGAAGAADPILSGDLAVSGFGARDLVRDQPWLRWQSLAVEQLELTLAPDRLQIGRILLDAPWLDAMVHEDASTSIGRMLVAAETETETETEAEAEVEAKAEVADEPPEVAEPQPAPAGSLAVAIDQFAIQNGELEFQDLSLPLPFATRVRDLAGVLNDYSNRREARISVTLDGAIDRYGEARILAEFLPAAPRTFTEFTLEFDNVDIASVTPYSAKFAGYAIDSGRLDLDLEYRIEEQLLHGENRILIRELQLGERVEVPGAANLPLRLAVALLKDSRGNVALDLPVRGDLGNPQVSVGGLIWKALSNVITKVATAPFAALGRLVGAQGADLEHIGFDPGAAELRPSQLEVADKLARALAERPELALGFGGCAAQADDGRALRAAHLAAALAERRDAASTDDDAAAVNPALRQLFVETFSEAAWTELEMAHAQAPTALAEAARERLLAAQPLAEEDLAQLALARRQAVLDYLAEAGVEPQRLQAVQPGEADSDAGRVFCRFELQAP